MKAGDMMTTSVVTVRPDASAHSIALLLWKKGISAVPVVDENGVPLGMISEGDLMPRDQSEREARRDWWLKALAEGEELNPEFLQYLQSGDRSAHEIMITPIVSPVGGEATASSAPWIPPLLLSSVTLIVAWRY